MVLIQDRILKIDIYNFEMSYKTPEKSLKSNQIYSVHTQLSCHSTECRCWQCKVIIKYPAAGTLSLHHGLMDVHHRVASSASSAASSSFK